MVNELNSEEIKKMLNPAHLDIDKIPSMKQLADKQTTKEDTIDEKDPRTQREYEFNFKWISPTQQVFEGKFKNRFFNFSEQAAAGRLKASMCDGMSWESFDPGTQELFIMLSHLMLSLIERPSWAEDLGTLFYREILYKLWEEVMAHEAIFRGQPISIAKSEE